MNKTTETILIIGVIAVAAIFLLKKSTPVVTTPVVSNPKPSTGTGVTGEINAGASLLNAGANLVNSF